MTEPLQAPGLGPAGRPRSALARALIPVSWVYGSAARLRRGWLEGRARRLARPVVSVGNITSGGTGKTPTVEMVARDLIERGRKPAILSRGYGPPASSRSGSRGGDEREPGSDGLAAVGAGAPAYRNDEHLVLAENLPRVPHYQGRDRYGTGVVAIERGADVLVLDDGFQHARLHRDLDIVLIDAIFPFGHGRVLPAGLLREPLGVLERADLFAITRADQVEPRQLDALDAYLLRRFRGIPRIHLRTEAVEVRALGGESRPPESLRGQTVLAFCGVGNPEAFRRQILALGARLAGMVCFRDHHPYSRTDLEGLRDRAARLGAETVLMTQKDAVKIRAGELARDWSYLKIEQRIARGADAYGAALDDCLSRPG